MSKFGNISKLENESVTKFNYIILVIKDNIPTIFIYLLLQLPLFIFGNYSNDIDFIIKSILWQFWLAVFLFMIYTMKYNIRKDLIKELEKKKETLLED